MSNAIAQKATDLASSGISLDTIDHPLIKSIVLQTAATKSGGMTFQVSTLFTKVCKEIKSRAGIGNNRLPDLWAKAIMAEIESLPKLATETILEQGYKLSRQSASKVKVSFRDMNVKRNVQQTYEKLGTLEMQSKDLHWMIVTAKSELAKVVETQPKDMEHREKLEAKATKLEENIKAWEKLLKIIKLEIDEQQKLAAETQQT